MEYTRNDLGQVTTVESTYDTTTLTVAEEVEYEPFGPLKALTFGNSLGLSRTFDQQYRLTDQTTGSVQDLGFALDAAGNIDAITDGVNGGLSQGFAQDALHRITTEAGSYGTKNYTFDSVGNRLTRTHGAATQTLTYTATSNRMATHDGQTVSLDATGNTLANPAENLSFTYGAHNRQLEAYVGSVLKATFVYNGQGQRVKKIEAAGAQRTFVYHYGQGGELLGETVYSSAGAKIGERDYLWLDTLPLAQSERTFSGGSVTNSDFAYVHADQLNTPRLATNASGTIVWRWDSDAFGLGAANQDPDNDTNLVNIRLRFPGQYLDEETGLHYNYFRDYDPATGRYVQSDPIGLNGGINTYGYARANPLRYLDPLGLSACSDLVDALISLWAIAPSSRELGSQMLDRRNTTLDAYDGFKPELVAGGQGGDVSRHIYGHGGAVLAYPLGPGLGVSLFEQTVDYLQRFQEGRTEAESSAEIAGDRAGRQVAQSLSDAMRQRLAEEEALGGCIDTRPMAADLKSLLESILCTD